MASPAVVILPLAVNIIHTVFRLFERTDFYTLLDIVPSLAQRTMFPSIATAARTKNPGMIRFSGSVADRAAKPNF